MNNVARISVGAIGGKGGTETENPALSNVKCTGNESYLLECSVMNTTVCSSEEIATVICQGIFLICCLFQLLILPCLFSDTTIEEALCNDGEFRLVNGSNPLEGRVESCFI